MVFCILLPQRRSGGVGKEERVECPPLTGGRGGGGEVLQGPTLTRERGIFLGFAQ